MKNFLKITILLSAVLLCSCDANLSALQEKSKSDNTFTEENMTSYEDSGKETKSNITNDSIPEIALTQAELLTEQFVNHVMTPSWLESDYTYTEWDYHYFIVTMTRFAETPEYPYYTYFEVVGNNEYFRFPLEGVKKSMIDIFDEDEWYKLTPEVYSGYESLFDEESGFYSIALQAGINTTVFSHENIITSSDGNTIYVEFDLVNSKMYEFEEMYYGRYRCVYTWDFDTETLEYNGIEKITEK